MRARRGSRTSCRDSRRRAACASTASGATGATWAPSRPTGRPTQTCSPRSRPWTSTTPTRVERAILDDRVEVGRGARIGEENGDIALVGLRAAVEPGAELPGGARFPAVEE